MPNKFLRHLQVTRRHPLHPSHTNRHFRARLPTSQRSNRSRYSIYINCRNLRSALKIRKRHLNDFNTMNHNIQIVTMLIRNRQSPNLIRNGRHLHKNTLQLHLTPLNNRNLSNVTIQRAQPQITRSHTKPTVGPAIDRSYRQLYQSQLHRRIRVLFSINESKAVQSGQRAHLLEVLINIRRKVTRFSPNMQSAHSPREPLGSYLHRQSCRYFMQ